MNAFPPIKSLFSQAWLAFKSSLLNLLLIGFFNLIFLFVFGIIVLVFAIGLGVFKNQLNISSATSLAGSPFIFPIIAVFVGALILFMIVLTSTNTASIIAIGEYENKPSFLDILGRGFKLFIPVFLTSMITGFLSFGASILFLLPGLIFNLLFGFASYEVIFTGKKYTEALKSSVQIVTQHFGDIFVRVLVYFLLSVLLSFIPGFIRIFEPKQVPILSLVVQLILNIGIGWYGLAYGISLYRQAYAVTDFTKKASLLWYWVISFIGWIIFVLWALLMVSLFRIYQEQNVLKKDTTKITAKILTTAPSSCGLSIPIPATTDASPSGEVRKWLYEEIPVGQDEYFILDKDVFLPKIVLGAFVAFKNEKSRLGETKEFSVAYPGLNIYCVDNFKNFSLEEYKSLALASKNFKVTAQKNVKWGEVEFVPVVVEGLQKGKQMKDYGYLAVTADNSRLIYLRVWGVNEDDRMESEIELDKMTILRGLKYRNVGQNLSNMDFALPKVEEKASNLPVAPSCTRFNIREGEFASNKCYSQKDYQDLDYYIDRFNSAVFSYNGANSQMSVTCNGSDFFKNQCDQNKQEKAQAESDMTKYRGIINAIITRGTN